MKKHLSSMWTRLHKFIIPLFLLLFFVAPQVYLLRDFGQNMVQDLIQLLWLTAPVAYIYRYQLPLKKVYAEHNNLYISNYRKTIEVSLSSIEKVTQTLYIAKVVHVTLDSETSFGKVIRFRPQGGIMREFNPCPAIEYLARTAGLNHRPDVYKATRREDFDA